MAPLKEPGYGQTMRKEIKSGEFYRDLVAEFVGTFLLVFTQLVLLQNWQTAENTNPQALAVLVGLGMAFVVGAIGYALGDFGGAHMNPAVTLTFVMRAEITFWRGLMYWVVQLLAGIISAFYVVGVTPAAQLATSKLGNTYLGTGVAWWQGMLIEMTITSMLCLTALATANTKRKGYIILPTLPVGMALGLGLLLAMNSTGASMNPARSLGPCVAASAMLGINDCWTYHHVYWLGPFLGAAVAAILYWIFDSIKKPKSTGGETAFPAYDWNPGTLQPVSTYAQPENVTTVQLPSAFPTAFVANPASGYYPY